METNARVSSMTLYEDESVDVCYGDGAQLQLSPCGCEFTLLRPTEPSVRPTQPAERVRQRTRFTTSTYKELMVAALAFRNKYAARPYLPEELIPTDHKKPFLGLGSEVQWPDWSSRDAEAAPGGETVVRSEEGRAVLTLSPSGEEFSVEFACGLSRPQGQRPGGQPRESDKTEEVRRGRGSRKEEESVRSRRCSPRTASAAEPKPETMHQSTAVTQHHSCHAVAPVWSHPLALARRLRTSRLSEPEEVGAGGANASDPSPNGRRSHLPRALPLTCPSPHWHRWKLKDPLAKEDHSDQDPPTELVKVMWCHGITYRILSGGVSVVEVSPGDGSVIRSDGVLNTYFIHHKPELQPSRVKEVTYHLNNLPPDVPGQLYSICTIVSLASRILSCYDEAKRLLKSPAAPSCLQEDGHLCKPAKTESENLSSLCPVEQHVDVTQTEDRSDLVATELEKIKRFNFLLDNDQLLRGERRRAEPRGDRIQSIESPAEEASREEVNESSVADALRRTSKAIEDIDALISAAALT